MEREVVLAGGNTGGAVRVGDTVRRGAGKWTPSVHAVLKHLEAKGFDRAPRALGFDEQGREVLSYLPGNAVGSQRPWPPWVHTDQALVEAATWMKEYHEAVADFVPQPSAVWRQDAQWEPGFVIGHNDAAPYNAAWIGERLTGFFDWDFAAPVSREWDLAFAACSWVPLHAQEVAAQEGFRAFDQRQRRLILFLRIYGWTGSIPDFLDVMRERIASHADGVVREALKGDPDFQRLVAEGTVSRLNVTLAELKLFADRC